MNADFIPLYCGATRFPEEDPYVRDIGEVSRKASKFLENRKTAFISFKKIHTICPKRIEDIFEEAEGMIELLGWEICRGGAEKKYNERFQGLIKLLKIKNKKSTRDYSEQIHNLIQRYEMLKSVA